MLAGLGRRVHNLYPSTISRTKCLFSFQEMKYTAIVSRRSDQRFDIMKRATRNDTKRIEM